MTALAIRIHRCLACGAFHRTAACPCRRMVLGGRVFDRDSIMALGLTLLSDRASHPDVKRKLEDIATGYAARAVGRKWFG